MPAPVPDPARRPDGPADGDPPDPDPEVDAATARLRSLLQPADPWRERVDLRRLDLRRLTDRLADVGPGRTLAVLVAALVLGAAAFVIAGPSRGSSVDPVQVLPRADPASASTSTPAPAPPSMGGAAAPPGSAPVPISVHAAGAVAVAGVHRLPAGARVTDLIAAAGGLSADADADRINLAAPVRDGERVYVPRRGEATVPEVVAGGDGGSSTPAGPAGPAGGTGPGDPSAPTDRVDLNRADADALDALPGIGPATADAILRYRAEHGPFRSVDDLQEVPGIGPAKLAQLRDLVRVG